MIFIVKRAYIKEQRKWLWFLWKSINLDSSYLSCSDSTHHTLASCTHFQSTHLGGESGWWKCPDILTPFWLCSTSLISSLAFLKILSVIFCNSPFLPEWKIARSSERTASLLKFMKKWNLIFLQCWSIDVRFSVSNAKFCPVWIDPFSLGWLWNEISGRLSCSSCHIIIYYNVGDSFW